MNDSGEHAANQITEPSKDEQDISSSMLLNDQHQLNNAGLKRKTQTDGNILNPATKQAGISVDSNTSKEITKPKKKAENKADSAAQLPNPKDGSQESLGLKRFLVGISYQQKLAIVILCHVAKQMEDDKKFDFTITSEDPEAGKFDDIAVRFNFGGRSSRLFIQAKHKEDETKTITWADLKSVDKNAPFSVCKYLNSFLQQKWDTDEEPPILALCTTIGLAEDVKKSAEPYTSPESIVNSIFNSVANEIYNIDIDKLDSDSRNSLFEHVRENSELVCLTKQLAKQIFDGKMLDFRNVLFQKYRHVIETQIATNERVKGDYFKLNEQFLNTTDAEEFKMIFETEYKRLYKVPDQDIWQDIRKKGIGMKKAQNAEPECKLPEKIEDHQIQKFFKSFILVSNTKQEQDIPEVITSILEINSFKLLPEQLQGPVSPTLVYNKLSDWTLSWIKQKDNKPLTKQDVDDIFKQLVSSLQFLQFQGISNVYCETLQSSRLMLKRERLLESELYHVIESTLSKTNSQDILYQCSHHPSIVWQVLELLERKLNYIFIEEKYFNLIKDPLMEVLLSTKYPLILFIDCKENPNEVEMYFEGWMAFARSMKKPPCYKKVILNNQLKNSTLVRERFLFGDLTDEYKDEQVDKNVCFFGTTLWFFTLMRDDDSLSFWLDVKEADDRTQMKKNINKDNFEKISPTYIHRQWTKCNEESKRGTSSFDFWKRRDDVYGWVERFTIDDYSAEMRIGDFLEKIWNRIPVRDTSWRKPQICDPPPGVIFNEIRRNYDTKLHIFLNEAGSGKSFYLTWAAEDLQTAHPSWWVVKLNLIEYSTDFHRLMETEGYETMDALKALKILFQLIYLAIYVPAINPRKVIETDRHREKAQACANMLDYSDETDFIHLKQGHTNLTSEQIVLLRIFQNKFNWKELVVLLDGFDEISPHYKKVTLTLIRWFERLKGVCKLYLTSRPYDFRTDFEASVEHCQFYRLLNLTPNDILSYTYRMLSGRFEGFKSLEEKMQDDLVLMFFYLSTSYLGEMSEIPLFLSMELELLLPIVKQRVDLKSSTISLEIVKQCDQRFEPLRMMEIFVERKLNIANTEKSGATDAAGYTSGARVNADLQNEWNLRIHSLLALHVVIDEKDRLSLLTSEERKDALQYIQNVNRGIVKSGIVDGAVDNVPIFIHRLFAEFFAARWFYVHQDRDGVKEFLKWNIYDNNAKEEIKHLIDRMVCSKNELHLAVLEGSKVKIENLLETNPTLIHAEDSWGRIPLHLVLIYGSKRNYDIFTLLLQRTDNSRVNLKDSYFGWSPINYAFSCDRRDPHSRYHFLVDLLDKGGTIHTGEFFTTVYYNDPVALFITVINFEHNVSIKNNNSGKSLSRAQLKSLFENMKIAENLTTKLQLDLHCAIPSVKIHTFLPIYNDETIAPFIKNAGSFTPLELCIIIDSVLTESLVECAWGGESMPSDVGERFASLACRSRSLSAFHYFYFERQYSVLVNNFEKSLMKVLIGTFIPSDFDSLYREYCSDFSIACREDLPQLDEKTDYGDFEVKGQNNMLRYFPKELVITESGIDSGTEFLLATALKIDSFQIVNYLVEAIRMKPTKNVIINLLKQYSIHWQCSLSQHHLLARTTDRSSIDDNGRNLLHTAVVQGVVYLVKCLRLHFNFDVWQPNEKENNWNALFYCVLDNENKENRYRIFRNLTYGKNIDCFNMNDLKKKSLFEYAVENNNMIGSYLCPKPTTALVLYEGPVSSAVNSNTGQEKTNMDDSPVNSKTDQAKANASDTPLRPQVVRRIYPKRIVLWEAIRDGNLDIVKSCINVYGQDVTEQNPNEYNWNAFFYCVSESTYGEKNCTKKLNIFTYMMDKNPFDCFAEEDRTGRCVFFYATMNNEMIAKYIFKRECSVTKNLLVEERVNILMGCLDKSYIGVSVSDRLKYLHENNLLSEKFVGNVCECLQNGGKLNYINIENGRNLLHIAVFEGWTDMVKVLINRYHFDPMAPNKEQYNWNAFFYCVITDKNGPFHFEIFTFMMDKDPIDCCGLLDSFEKSVLDYALKHNKQIARAISEREQANV